MNVEQDGRAHKGVKEKNVWSLVLDQEVVLEALDRAVR